MDNITEYTEEIQEMFLKFLVSDPELFVRVNNIVEPYMFNRKYQDTVQFLKQHSTEYSSIPTIDQITATTGVELERIEGITEIHTEWFLDSFVRFCRHKALEKAILDSTDLLEKADYGAVENKIKDASQVSLVKDLGLEYFENPKERLQYIKSQAGAVSTGWKKFDQKLYGGLNRGEITIFAGGSGAGKSLFLANLGCNWILNGMNVAYVTFELSEPLVSMRVDSMLTDIPTKEIFKDLDGVEMKVKLLGKKSGKLQIKYMPSGKTANDLRSWIKEYEIKTGVKLDVILVDYLDLMMPINKKVSPSDLFVKDKFVSEELRNLAMELNVIFVTASQLNRGAVEEIEFDHSHIAGGLSKIQTADNVFGIFTSRAMRERGRYQIQLMKTRSSSGVGMKIDLEFDVDSLRIRDLSDDSEYQEFDKRKSTIYNSLKKTSTVTDDADTKALTPPDPTKGDTVGRIKTDTDGTKLREFLNDLGEDG